MTATQESTAAHAVSRDGTHIGYYTTGQGPPLVLVHGGLGDHTRWAALRPYLEPHFTVCAMDRRGRGASGDHSDYDVAREFEDVAAVVDAVADSTTSHVTVVGSSAGASFAVAAAALTPNIGRLVLFEPATGELMKLLPPELQDQLDALLAADDREGILQTAYRQLVGLSDEQIDDLRAQPSWANRLTAAHTVPRELRIPPERFFDPRQAEAVAVPALVMIGGETPEPFRVGAQHVADTLPHASVAVLEGQGHGAELFAPALVADAMLEFLGEGA